MKTMMYYDLDIYQVSFSAVPSPDLLVVLSEYNLNCLFDGIKKATDHFLIDYMIHRFFELCPCDILRNIHLCHGVETYDVNFSDGGCIKFFIYYTPTK